MATETILDELKINYLTEEQYAQALANGTLNENEIYMTPDEDEEHTHTISQIDGLQEELNSKETKGASEDALASAKSYTDSALASAKSYTDGQIDSIFSYGTTDLEAGVTPLEYGKIYLVLEE